MAVSTNSYFSNSIIGIPQVGADIDIYDTSSTPKYAVGFGFERADGNKYRYCHFGLLSPVGSVVAPDNLESSTTSTAMSLQVLSATLYKPAGETVNPNAVGSRYLQINNTGANFSVAQITADQFAGGYITFVVGSGTGYTYRIKGNNASGTPATGETYIELYDKLYAAVDTTTAFVINGSKYANLEPAQSITHRLGLPVGFVVVGQTISNYGWICTRGLTTAVTGIGIGSVGHYAIVSTNTAGAIQSPYTGATTNTVPPMGYIPVGVIAQTYSNSTYALINALLE
jgi:hypothetical protein